MKITMESISKKIIKVAAKEKVTNWQQLINVQLEILKKTGDPLPKGADLLKAYKHLIDHGAIKKSKRLEDILKFNSVRTISGVAPVAILTKPFSCPGKCIYCPTEKDMPKSYLSDEPAVMRAVRVNFDPRQQVINRIAALEATGHNTEKIELIVMGGTFSALPDDYKKSFIKEAFDGMNNKSSGSLESAHKLNEKAFNRCIGLTVETRPDYINNDELELMRLLGVTRVELGVQSIYDDVLEKTMRGHSVSKTIEATKLLKDHGFKVSYHIMPNLPGSNLKRDLEMFKILFDDEHFKPDQLKIYPCVAVEESELYDWHTSGIYKPYTSEELIELLSKVKSELPYYIRISRLFRDIPTPHIKGGVKQTNFRQILKTAMTATNKKCRCLRCREIKDSHISNDRPALFIDEYRASNGNEVFLSFENQAREKIYAFLRLRLNDRPAEETVLFDALKQASIVRELHTYGRSTSIGSIGKIQHTGFGKKLIQKAEEITLEKGLKNIAVISGVGARDYYKKLDYELQDGYMVKKL